MTWLSKVVLVAAVAVFTVVAASACSSAIAQTDEELAAGFTAEKPININIYLPGWRPRYLRADQHHRR
jgi:hypothetical protein